LSRRDVADRPASVESLVECEGDARADLFIGAAINPGMPVAGIQGQVFAQLPNPEWR